jgi:hypothetical protein
MTVMEIKVLTIWGKLEKNVPVTVVAASLVAAEDVWLEIRY